MNISGFDYEEIDNPFDSSMEREGGFLGSPGMVDLGGAEENIKRTPEGVNRGEVGDADNVIEGQDLENLWISSWIKSRSYLPGRRGFMLDGKTGKIECGNLVVRGVGEIGGWNIDATRIYSDGDGLILDSSVPSIESGNYVSGYAGAGVHLSPNLLEVGNIACRGIFRSAVIQYDNILAYAGNQIVAMGADVLAVDMTVADNSTIEIENDSNASAWAIDDILELKDANDVEWLKIVSVSGNVYTCDRDQKGDYGAGANPAWKKGQAIVNYGQSGDGGIYMTASEANAPYLNIFTHAGSPWTGLTERLRIGKLDGYLGYPLDGDKYGIGIGDADNYLKFDPTDKLQIKVSGVNALKIEYGSDILLEHGGDIKFTSVTSPTACVVALIEIAGNVDVGTHKYKITYVNATGETELGAVSNTVTNDGTHKQNALTSILTSSSGSVTSRKIYRTKVGGDSYYLLATIADNTTTTYTDNTADASLTGAMANDKQNDSFGKILVDGDKRIVFTQSNIFLGKDAGKNNIGNYNILLGDGAGENNIGSHNILLGYDAGKSSVSNSSQGNVLIGGYAGVNNYADYNTFVGYNSGHVNSSGYDNTFIGSYAGYSQTSGYENTFVGHEAGYINTSSYHNTFLGYKSGRANSIGYDNLFVGYEAGYTNLSGNKNTFLGNYAGYTNYSGDYNTFVGHEAGYTNNSEYNLFLGYNAGYYETGSYKLFIDNQSRGSEANGRISSLVYGIFNSTPTDQTLRLTASVGINTEDFGSGKVVLALANASTVPSADPTGGGVIYCEGGALKYRGSSGTITTLGVA